MRWWPKLSRRLRITEPRTAYAACALIAPALVAVPGALFVVASVACLGRLAAFDPAAFVIQGIGGVFGAAAIGLLIAWPFLLPATILARRLRMESALFYGTAGGLSMAAMMWLLLGPPEAPDPLEFMDERPLWAIAVGCAVAWGLCWWYLHRRWLAQVRPSQ